MKLFAVLDVKANHYLKPFCEPSTIQALRGFDVASNEAGSTFNRFPDDFCLMELGEFDVQAGAIIPLSSPLNLGSARSLLKPTSQESASVFGSAKQ